MKSKRLLVIINQLKNDKRILQEFIDLKKNNGESLRIIKKKPTVGKHDFRTCPHWRFFK